MQIWCGAPSTWYRVLEDAVASRLVDRLRAAGDSEGDIAYDPEVEFIAQLDGYVGMSGGPVLDEFGRLVGLMVRATETEIDAHRYVRAVRLSYVETVMVGAFDDGDEAVRRFYIRP